MNLPKLLLWCFFALLFAACEKDEPAGTKDDPKSFDVTLLGESDNAYLANLPATECVLEFKIDSNTKWTLSVPEWTYPMVQSGDGSMPKLAVTVSANDAYSPRSGKIVFSFGAINKTIEITQQGKKDQEVPGNDPGIDDIIVEPVNPF